MPRYEYKTTFVELPSDRKWYEIAPTIDPHSLVASGQFKEHLNQMGSDGWRLVTVEALNIPTESTSTIAFTKGYYFFWERILA